MHAQQIELFIANCIVTFNLMLGAEQGLLDVSYVFENRSDRPALVFNLLTDAGEHPALTEPSRVSIWPEGEQLEIAKMAYPAPPDTLLETLYIPMATLVPAGETFSEKITIRLPFRLWHPYFSREEASDEALDRLKGILVRIGFILADPAYLEDLEPVPLAGRKLYAVPAMDPAGQHIAEASMPVDGLPGMIAPR